MAKIRGTSPSVTIADVAQAAGVAPMTVSRFLNNHPNVTEKTARKVRGAISKLGYKPNHAARMLMGQPSKVIGLVVPNLSDPFFAEVTHNVEEVARTRGYLVWVASSNGDSNTEMLTIDRMKQHHVDGILLIPTMGQHISKLPAGELPIVTIDRPISGGGLDSVIVENRKAAREGVEHLIGHGYTRIACLGFDGGLFTIEERIAGYEDAMRDAGLELNVHRIRRSLSDNRDFLNKSLAMKPPIQAIFTLNNVATVLAIEALDEAGVEVPKRIALLGFDDFELASVIRPRMTVIRQSAASLGNRATRLLFERLGSVDASDPFTISLPAALIIRESCGCPAATADRSIES